MNNRVTNYSDIIELVLALLKSYEIDGIYDELGEDYVFQFFMPYFKYASGELEILDSGIDTSRDDEIQCFTTLLSDGSQLLFAKYVLIGYLEKNKNDILQMRLHLQDGDFKTFAEANNLTAKQNALEQLKEEVAWGVKKNEYRKLNVWE